MRPGHEPISCFETTPVPLARLLYWLDPRYGFSSNLPPGESSVKPSVDRKTTKASLRVLSRLFGGPPGPGFRLGNRPLFCRTIAPATKSRQIPDDRFDALAFRLLESLGAREVGVVRTTLEDKDSLEDFEVRLWELVKVSRVEGSRHTPIQQGLNDLGPSAGEPSR